MIQIFVCIIQIVSKQNTFTLSTNKMNNKIDNEHTFQNPFKSQLKSQFVYKIPIGSTNLETKEI